MCCTNKRLKWPFSKNSTFFTLCLYIYCGAQRKNVITQSNMFPTVHMTNTLNHEYINNKRCALCSRLLLLCCLTLRLFWKYGVWALLDTSARPCTSLNLCWWWAQHCTSTQTFITHSSHTFRYGCTFYKKINRYRCNHVIIIQHKAEIWSWTIWLW